ncbi:hypothetical protein CVT24_010811 [Panaeolus cyanescens]|uniref:Uncharacterized protein n=1 Tax=Panaeolus cyanescens TaxID=181874 RepID=A0A409VH11_9AGAR|nr:hypothetical protein CVT24_010811 [Panaeolus cyanescens]
MATTTDFPERIRDAAKQFRSECTAWTQFRLEPNGKINIRLQAPDIMQQFVGDVEFGRDPKGLLFYNNAASDFAMRDHDFQYTKLGNGPWKTVIVDFYETEDTDVVARFIARVDTSKYSIPGEGTTRRGNGKWSKFPGATAQTTVIRGEGRNRLYLQFPALKKYVYFKTTGTTAIEKKSGVLIFKDYNMLQDFVDNRAVLADCASDRIVFRTERSTDSVVVALFIPNEPLTLGPSTNDAPSPTTWKPFDPRNSASGFTSRTMPVNLEFEDEDVDEDCKFESNQSAS